MTKPWRIEKETYYEKFKIFSLKKSTRINPKTGEPFDFFLMEGFDWGNIIALTPSNEVILVRQFRQGCDEVTLEIPGGVIEAGEKPADAILRELTEETGFTAKNLELLGTFYPNPAMQAMRCHAFFATDAVKVADQMLDEAEDIEVVLVPLDEVYSLMRTGKITHSIVLSAFCLYQLKKNV